MVFELAIANANEVSTAFQAPNRQAKLLSGY